MSDFLGQEQSDDSWLPEYDAPVTGGVDLPDELIDHDWTEDDYPCDDGQPDEYTEWQDYMGGDDWDHGQYDCD